MAAQQQDNSWMWHPEFCEDLKGSAGLFVHFRRTIHLVHHSPAEVKIHITADTRYQLFVNQQLVSFGPIKGDANLWFYDEVDIAPYLRTGRNVVGVTVLRFFYATSFAPSFPRLPFGGLRIVCCDKDNLIGLQLESSTEWEATIDTDTVLRIDEPEDDFLHVYERITRPHVQALSWTPAQLYSFQVSTGRVTPWRLSPRLIPPARISRSHFTHLHNIQSTLSETSWRETLLSTITSKSTFGCGITLPKHSSHSFDLEADYHTTAFLHCRFQRPLTSGSTMSLTYAESYENTPTLVPYLRQKGHRRDTNKQLLGPSDTYTFAGIQYQPILGEVVSLDEIYTPFHFRTFRFIRVRIDIGSSELVLHGFDFDTVNYPLEIRAAFEAPSQSKDNQLWTTSLRTLKNCMHDCYEDCPFYEQLQYAMDSRSSSLFTYYSAGDDRMARQAILQLHASIDAHTGLTASRAPSHDRQTIPHFSLFWICMLSDHLTFFNDTAFLARFTSSADAILKFFDLNIHPLFSLVTADDGPGIWNFVDWTNEWRPYGIPPAATRTGFCTYTNLLYGYTLQQASFVAGAVGRTGLAKEYLERAARVVKAVKLHCCVGDLFTDGLAELADSTQDYSEHTQVWAVLSGAATGAHSQRILRQALEKTPLNDTGIYFTPTSTMMSFYTRRALSLVGGGLYDELYDRLWAPWREQLALGLTTWEEDSVSRRSDCHAWGSVPIYEFMSEVAGVRPAAPGWAAIEIQPRLALYEELRATVPVRVSGELGSVQVSWSKHSETQTKVTLRSSLPKSVVVPVYVKLPGQPIATVTSSGVLTYMVENT